MSPQSRAASANSGTPMETTYFADNSVVTMARHRSPPSRDGPARQSAFETGILPLLGLEDAVDTSTIPWSTLPGDQELVRLFEVYRQRVHPFHGITYNLEMIEMSMCLIMRQRAENNLDNSSASGDNLRFLSLLHAILASGAQFSEMPLRDRTAISQRHTKHAFDGLRASDYLARATTQTIQTLLLLGNVLQNDMKPQAAWVLGGTTIRLAQCLGIHENRADRLLPGANQPDEAKHLRLVLPVAGYLRLFMLTINPRLSIVWQDALLALAFGRPPASHEMDLEEDLRPLGDALAAETPGISYIQAMNWLCRITICNLPTHKMTPAQLLSTLDRIDFLQEQLPYHMSSLGNITSIRGFQEAYAYDLHKNFVISTLCRPFISSSGSKRLDDASRPVILSRFRDSLRRSVGAYLRLRSITGHARRSWAFIHNGLTSVLLLSLMRETRYLSETWKLQDEMMASLSEGDRYSGASDENVTSHLSHSLKKVIKAIQTLQRLAKQEMETQDIDPELSGAGHTSNGFSYDTNAQGLGPGMDAPNFWDAYAAEMSIPVDFDLSPLGAFDYLMSDENFASNPSFLPGVI